MSILTPPLGAALMGLSAGQSITWNSRNGRTHELSLLDCAPRALVCVARSARRRESAERLRTFLSGGIEVARFDEDDARTAGDLRAAGTPIWPYDLLIAAQALCTSATLVTVNVAEFARVPGLQWQDWTAKA